MVTNSDTQAIRPEYHNTRSMMMIEHGERCKKCGHIDMIDWQELYNQTPMPIRRMLKAKTDRVVDLIEQLEHYKARAKYLEEVTGWNKGTIRE